MKHRIERHGTEDMPSIGACIRDRTIVTIYDGMVPTLVIHGRVETRKRQSASLRLLCCARGPSVSQESEEWNSYGNSY